LCQYWTTRWWPIEDAIVVVIMLAILGFAVFILWLIASVWLTDRRERRAKSG
jgi:hypothetical protein